MPLRLRRAAVVSLTGLLGGWLGAPLAGQSDSAPQPQANQTFEDEITVLEIEVPVQVFDQRGQPVRGLTRKDFEVRYRGELRPIVDFEAVDLSIEREAAGEPTEPVRVDPSGRRALLFLFDFTYQSSGLLARALDHARGIVSDGGLHPSDRAAVVVLGGRQGARILTGFTPDRERTLVALDLVRALADRDAKRQRELTRRLSEGAPNSAEGIAAEYGVSASVAFGDGLSAVSITATPVVGIASAVAAAQILDSSAAIASGVGEAFEIGERLSRFSVFQGVSFYAEALGNLGTLLSGVEGQKYALLFSQGPPASAIEGQAGPGASEGAAMVAAAMERAFSQLVRAGWAIHALGQGHRFAAVDGGGVAIDSLGGASPIDAPAGASTDGGSALFYMAEGTGGRSYTNSLEPALETFLEQTAVSYVLRFQLEEVRPRAGKETFQIVLMDPEVAGELRYRDFFYAPKPRSQMNDVERQIADADRRIREQERRVARNLEFAAHAFLDPHDAGVAWLAAHLPAHALARERADLEAGESTRLGIVAGIGDGSAETRVALSAEMRVEESTLAGAPFHGLTFVGRLDLGGELPTTGAVVRVAVELGARGTQWAVPLQTWDRDALVGPFFVPAGLERLILRAEGQDGLPVELPLATPGGGELVPLPFGDVRAGDALGILVLSSATVGHAPSGTIDLTLQRHDQRQGGSEEVLPGIGLESRGVKQGLVLWFATVDTSALQPGLYRVEGPAGAEWTGLGHFRVHP